MQVFGQYWLLGTTNAVPETWPAELETQYTLETPLQLVMNGGLLVSTGRGACEEEWDSQKRNPSCYCHVWRTTGTLSDFFFSLSPPPAQPPSWTDDAVAITTAMFDAEEFIWIEVMDYMPALIYVNPTRYWNTIDNAIRKASYKCVTLGRFRGGILVPASCA